MIPGGEMIKRTAATSFLLLAGILFLGHAVVPHHHHGNFICFAKSHCTGEEPDENPCSSPDNHHHDGGDGTDQCLLKDPAIVSSNQPGHFFKIPDKKISQPWNDNLTTGLQVYEPASPDSGLWLSLSEPPGTFLHSSLSLPSSGLRAPPMV